MAVLAIFTGKGITKENYEVLRKEVNWERQHPAGGIFHSAGFDASGDLHVADVWDSAEDMEEFVKTRLGPVMQKLGVRPPTVEVYTLHNANAFRSSARYMV